MRPSPAADSPLWARDPAPELRALVAALCRACGDAGRVPFEGTDSAALLDLARLNKALLHLVPPGEEGRAPAAVRGGVEAARLRATAMNLAALALSREAERILAATGLRPLHLKGPLQQIDLHGSPVARPSGDVDLLVRPRERRAAAAALRAAGFAEHERGLSPWWTAFLGETHFRRPPGAVVDLHHRLDQPGLPRVRGLGSLHASLHARAREQTWRGGSFLVPSRLDVALVAAIGVAKAAMGQEPCGGHLVDLRLALGRLGPDEREALEPRAEELGLRAVLALGLRALDATFGPATGRRWSPPGDRPLGALDDDALQRVLLAPWAAPPLRRRHMIWSLSAGSPLTFARRMGWWQLSIGVRATLSLVPARRDGGRDETASKESRP